MRRRRFPDVAKADITLRSRPGQKQPGALETSPAGRTPSEFRRFSQLRLGPPCRARGSRADTSNLMNPGSWLLNSDFLSCPDRLPIRFA
jgi:hypothetical protein